MRKNPKSFLESPTSNPQKTEIYSYKKSNTEISIPSSLSAKVGKNKSKTQLKDSFQEDEIIAAIAKKNIKNFLNYKRWKKSSKIQKTTDSSKSSLIKSQVLMKSPENPQKAPDSPELAQIQDPKTETSCKIPIVKEKIIEKKPTNSDSFKRSQGSLKNIYRNMIQQKQIMTKSLTDMQNLLNQNKFSRTFSGEFHSSPNSKKSHRKDNSQEKSIKRPEKNTKEMNKLAQIVTKVKNFKINFSDKNLDAITKLLESVKSLNDHKVNDLKPKQSLSFNNSIKTLKSIYSKPKKMVPILKKYIFDTAEKKPKDTINKPVLSIKLMKSQRKSFDQQSKTETKETATEKPKKKEISPSLAKKTEPCFIYYMSLLDYFIRNPNDLDYFNLLYREHFLQSIAAYNYCVGLNSAFDEKALAEKRVFLGPNPKNLKTLVFDLDETLVHCNEAADLPSDIKIDVKISENETITAGVNIRPFSFELLSELKEMFEIVIFTASHSSYANIVIDYLDPQKTLIKKRLFREQCMLTEQGIFIKDLRIFGDRKLENIILVDNALYSFAYQIDNGVPIIPFYDNKQDKELLSLKIYLESLSLARDFREINLKTFKFRQYDKFDNIEDLLASLFQGLDFDI